MFGEQASRLLREKWGNATMLAQELYAMFLNDIPLTTNAPLTINQPAGATQPPLTIKQPAFSDTPALSFQFGGQAAGSLSVVDGAPQLQDAQGKPVSGGGGGNAVPVWG